MTRQLRKLKRSLDTQTAPDRRLRFPRTKKIKSSRTWPNVGTLVSRKAYHATQGIGRGETSGVPPLTTVNAEAGSQFLLFVSHQPKEAIVKVSGAMHKNAEWVPPRPHSPR